MALSEDDEKSLTSGMDCHLHTHNFDRVITHDHVLQFQDNEGSKLITASVTLGPEDDFTLVDTTAGAVSIALPVARGGKTYTIVKVKGVDAITLTPKSPDTINGSGSIVISTLYSPVRLKAFKGIGWIQI